MKNMGHKLSALCLCTMALATVAAQESSLVRLNLQNTAGNTGAVASIVSLLQPRTSSLVFRAAQLTPGHVYSLDVGNIPEGEFIADAHGRVNITFVTPPRPGKRVLDFDPRGELVSLRDGTNPILQAVFSGPNEPADIVVAERTRLATQTGTGKATAAYQVLKSGRRFFTVKLQGVTGTNWSLYVDGVRAGLINVRGGSGSVFFDSDPHHSSQQLLDFDPRGHMIDISRDDNLIFSGECEAKATNVNVAIPFLSMAFIPSTGADPDGSALAEFRVDDQARRKFSVELENVPVGAYDLLVNGLLKGTINVAAKATETDGEIEFSSREDSGDELPLTFDPTNSTFTVQQSGVVYFQGQLAFSAGSTNANSAPLQITVPLFSLGATAGAIARADFRQDDRGRRSFEVEIEDAPVGNYDLLVGGIPRASISLQATASGTKGKIQFESEPGPGHLLLDFDPRNQDVTVSKNGVVWFERTFPSGS